MIGRGAPAVRLVLAGLLGVVLLGCGEAVQGGVPATTADAVTTTSTPAPSAAPTAATATTEAAVVTPGPTAPPVPTPPPTPTPSPASSPAPSGVARPNPRLTPGEVFPTATVAQVCTSGYSSSVRHVEHHQYVEVYAAYGVPYPQPSGTYELDHLIPLELGGDNSDANLWPEAASPAPGFHQKDDIENRVRALVCAGQLDLHEAQREIASNWYAAYTKYVGA